jgi:predicted KAP-like P-loop ATPase
MHEETGESDSAATALSADAPITTADQDQLSRTKLAVRIATEALTAPRDAGFVIGLSGEWGSGKSSIANLVEEHLGADERAVVVRFDPWFFSGTTDLLGCFFAELAAAIGKYDGLKPLASKISGYAAVLSNVAGVVPGVGGALAALLKATGVAADVIAEPEALEKRRKELATALTNFDGRVIVIIDDVDRLADSEVIEIVRLAKLVGDLPRMTYVLCFDRFRVEEVLGGGASTEARARGRAYMEKIVQSRFDVPPVRPAVLADLMVVQLNALLAPYPLKPPPQDDWINLLNFGIKPLLAVPRDGKRFANAIPAAVEILGDEVALVDLLALEAIRIFEPDVHAELPKVADVLVGGSSLVIPQENQHRIDALIEKARKPDVVKAILGRLFPESRVPLPNPRTVKDRRQERREKRVSRPEPFRAYLYATLDADVLASAEVERIMDLFADPASLAQALHEVSIDRLPDLLDRALDHELRMAPAEIGPVALAFLALHDSAGPDPNASVLSGRAPLEWQLSSILRALLGLAPADQQTEVATEVYESAQDLSSKLFVLQALATWPEEEGGQSGVFDLARTQKLAKQLAAETVAAATGELATEPRAARLLASAHKYGERGAASALNEMLADDALLLTVLVQSMVYGRAVTAGDASARLVTRVRWQQLIAVFDEKILRRRVEELDSVIDRDQLDSRVAEALELTLRVVRGEDAPDPDL